MASLRAQGQSMGDVKQIFFYCSAIVFTIGCQKPESIDPSSGPKKDGIDASATELHVEYSGCEELLSGPTCVLPENRELTVWIETAPEAKVVFGGGTTPSPLRIQGPVTVQGGYRYTLRLSPGSKRLVIQSSVYHKTYRWQLDVRESRPSPVIVSATELRNEGKLVEAAQLLKNELPQQEEKTRAQGLSLLARLLLQQNQIEPAIRTFQDAQALHKEEGHLGSQIRDATALAHTLISNGWRLFEARRVIESAPKIPKGDAFSQICKDNVSGILAVAIGDLRRAKDLTTRAALQVKRLGLTKFITPTEVAVAAVLERLGRYREAFETYESMWKDQDGHLLSPCPRARLLNARGWANVLAEEAGETPLRDPIPLLTEAVSIYNSDCSADPTQVVNAHLSLAIAYLQSRQPDMATQVLLASQKHEAGHTTRNVLWKTNVEARIALAKNQSQKALSLFSKLLGLARNAFHYDLEWRAIIGIAESLWKLKKHRQALEKFEEAEKLLDQGALRIAIGDGRAAFLAERNRAVEAHVELLLINKKRKEAMNVVRRARSRALQSVFQASRLEGVDSDQRDKWDQALSRYWKERDALIAERAEDWRKPIAYQEVIHQARDKQAIELNQILDQAFSFIGDDTLDRSEKSKLSEPEADEVIITYFQLGEQWIGFAADVRGVEARYLEPITEDMNKNLLSERLLLPFGEKIELNRRLRFLPHGPLENLDFHALLWKDRTIIASKQVVYGLDLFEEKTSSIAFRNNEHTKPKEATVVVDPNGDLFSSQEEGAMVKNLLKGINPTCKITFLKLDQARQQSVRLALEKSDFFHFSGHAAYRGSEGWDSALMLSNSEELLIRDILAMKRVPQRVVLQACDTSVLSAASVSTFNLARAFLVAGSRQVIGSTKPLPDRLAARMSELFYAYFKEDNFIEAFRKSQLALSKDSSDLDWMSLRLIVRY